MRLFLPLTILFSGCDKDSEENKVIEEESTLKSSTTELSFSNRGGSQVVTITSVKEWGFISCEDWITVDPKNSFEENTEVTISVEQNNITEARKGTVGFKSGTARLYLTINQSGLVKVTCTPESGVVDAAGGNLEFTVTTEPVTEWKASTEEEWLSVKCDGQRIIASISENKSTDSRKGIINVTSDLNTQEIVIRQRGSDNIVCPVSPDEYMLVWHDEFEIDGDLNTKDWRHEVQRDHWVNNELQNYVSIKSPQGNRVTEVLDGTLRINCFKEDGKVYSGRVYAHSSSGWKYGYMEASIKLPKGKGTWPAFWMMPVNFKSWPHDGEIDIMEEVGANPNYVSSSLHADAHVHSNNTQVTHEMYCAGAEGNFHVYGIEWTAEKITTYVDGKVQLEYKNRGLGIKDWPYDAPFYIILNLAWGGDWGGYKGIDDKALPLTMEVDYVRVFQKQ